MLASTGLDDTGGLDIDAAIVAYLGQILAPRDQELWRRLTRPVERADVRASRQLWDNVRLAKEVLSRATVTAVYVPLFDDDLPLGREQLDAVARPVLDRTVETIRDVSVAAGRSGPLVGIFLVGGASRMPLVKTLLHQTFGIAPRMVDQPELAVAEGALVWRSTVVPDAVTIGGPTFDDVVDVPGRRRLRRLLVAGMLAVIVAAAGVWLVTRDRQLPPGSRSGLASPSTATTPPPAPSPDLAIDPCLVGTWVATSQKIKHFIGGVPTQFEGPGGMVMTIQPDGTMVLGYTPSAPITAQVGRDHWTEQTTGTIAGRIRIVDRKLVLLDAKGDGSGWFTQNSQRRNTFKLAADVTPASYLCDERTFTEYTDNYQLQFVRRS